MPKIALKNSDEDFDLDGYLADQGMTVVGQSAKGALNSVRNRGNVMYQVRDQDGKEFDFDAHAFLRDQGKEPDLDLTFEREQKAAKAMKVAQQAETDKKLSKELEDAGWGEYMAKTAAPFTTALLNSGKISEDGAPGPGEIARTGLAVTADVLSLIPRGAVGAYEGLKKHFTGQGKDLGESMAQIPSYGADTVKDPETGKQREENLGEHWHAFKDAFRVDPAGVSKDLLRESARDPFTGAAVLAAASSGGTLSPALIGRAGPLLAQVASKYKNVERAVNVTQKAGRVLSKVQARLEQSNALTKIAASVGSEAVGGGMQGVLAKYAMGEDQDAWNTFVIEGVEEGAFGALMAPIHQGWHYMSQEQQVDAMNQVRDHLRQGRPTGQGVAEGEFSDVARTALPPPAQRLLTGGDIEGRSGISIQPLPNAPVTLVDGQPVHFDQALPPGVSRAETIKKIENPAYKTTGDIAAEKAQADKAKAVKQDVKLLKAETVKMHEAAQKEISAAMDHAITQTDIEDKAQVEAARKAHEAVQKDIELLVDPTKETGFPAWNRLFGEAYQGLDEKTKAFRAFHVGEAKKIKEIREEISPPAEGEGGKKKAQLKSPKAEAPAGDYIPDGGVDEAAANPGDGSGAQRDSGPDGREANPGLDVAGENRGAGPGEPGRGPENDPVVELPREPRDARPVDTENDLLPAPAQAVKAEQDERVHQDPEYRPLRAAAWGNIDLRKKSPIELKPSQRVAMNQHGKEVLDQFEADPSTLTEAGREVLRHYTGQGGLGVKADEEAAAGILNQHYTSYPVVKFAWDALPAIGYPMDRRLTALEPTAGIGNFIGHKPDNVDFHANEVDPTSARVMKALYPQNITNREGPFESYFGPKVDLVVTNVPFLSSRGAYEHLETDPKYKGIKSLHNYIMMKGIDQLHDNGVGIFITSTGTMDAATGAEFRKQFNLKAEILGAFRLPEGAFDKNTQYKGTVDMVLVRRRTRGEIANVLPEDRIQKEWVDTKKIRVKSDYGEGDANQSTWYEKHPEGVLGEFVYGHNRHISQTGVQLRLEHGEDLNKGLQRVFAKALETLKDKYVPAPGAESDPNLGGVGESVGRAAAETPVFGLEVKGGKVYRKARDGELRAFRPDAAPNGKAWDVPESRFVMLTEIMAAAQQLKELTSQGSEVGFLQEHIKTLLQAWKSAPKYPRQPMGRDKAPLFPGVKMIRRTVGNSHVMETKFGDGALEAFAGQDKRYNLLAGLYDKKLTGYGRTLTEKPAFREPPTVPRGDMAKAADVVKYQIAKFGVFQDAMARAEWKGTPEEYHREMLAHPDLNWDNGEFVHDFEYLQGDIRDKMDYSKKMGLSHQLKKLEAVLPEQKTGKTVQANPLATWWDSEALTAFAHSKGIMGRGYNIGRATEGTKESFHVLQGEKIIEGSRDPQLNEFVEQVLNQRPVKMDDPSGAINSKGDPIRVSDHVGSKKIKDKWYAEFETWARGPGAPHAERAAASFNKDYASISTGKEIESPLFIDGMSTKLDGREVKFYPSQMSLVRRAKRLHGYIAAHGVGHGKTIGGVATHAELRSQGVIKKAIYVVPSKNRGMWLSNITQLMPGIQAKVISSDGHQKHIDLVDAANNHYDVILVSYDTFKTIPLGKAEAYIREDIEKFKDAERKLASGPKGFLTNGQLKRLQEKTVKLENKLAEMQAHMKDPQGVVTFEDLNADAMFLDEAHTVKNSFEQMNEYADRPFLNKSTDSTVGNDMVYKTRYLHERNGRGGMFLLTATPTPNNPLEIYKIIKLVAPHEWTTRGINTSDDFIRNFVTIGPIDTPEMDGTTAGAAAKPREGITGWQNLNALRAILNKWMDFRKDNPDVKKPESLAIPTYVDMNDDQLNGMARILVLSEMSRKEQAKAGVNMASLTMNAKVLAIDPAFSDATLLVTKPNFIDRSPKLREAMKNVEKHFKANPDRNQIVFLDFFNIGDFEAITDENGLPVPWPQGFGDLGASEEGERVEPEWLGDLEEAQKAKMRALFVPSKSAAWPRRFLDSAGRPMKVTENTIKQYRPAFDAEGNVTIKVQHIKENLHESIARHAVEKLGMDPNRVIVVNGGKNGRPEDKTRIEGLVADGLVSLIVGNKPSVGEGLNLQNRGDAMHHIDVPWTPKELEQANGRMWRPRHETEDNHPVSIYNYVAKGSLDAKGYAVLGQKEKWQQELFTGHADFMDNTLNNLEKTGFSYKEMAESASVNPEYVAGYRLGAQVEMDSSNLEGAKKELERMNRAMEVQRSALANAVRTVENAKENIRNGIAKSEEAAAKAAEQGKPAPAPYDPTYWQNVIKNNLPATEAGPKLVAELQEKMKPFEQVAFDSDVNTRAKAMVKVARANKWRTLGSKLEGERAEAYRAMLQKVMPDINARYPLLADMMAAKAFGGSLPADLVAAEAALSEAVGKIGQDSQAGKVSAKLLAGVVATGALASFFGPVNTAALIGGGSAAVWAFRRLSHMDAWKSLTWSLHARLKQYPSFAPIEALFGQAHRLATTNISRTTHAMQEALGPLTEQERLLMVDKVENPALTVPPAVERAANVWRRVAAVVAKQAQQVGYGLSEDPTYYPRVLDFEKVQAMKGDPELLDRNVRHLMRAQNLSQEDAEGLLLNFFDNTEEMRIEAAAKRKEEMFRSLRARHPNMSDADMQRAYMRMKATFGERINGNLRFQRRVPMLLPEMYIRDPLQVLPRYLENTWKSVSYRKVFGPNLDMVRDFVDTEFPMRGEKPSPEREEVQDWLDTELYRNRFPSMTTFGDAQQKEDLARRLSTYHVWTKLFSSVLSPPRNIAAGFNMAVPLAGGRNTMRGIIKALQQGRTGFKDARVAGAISERVMRDAYETSKGTKGTFWDKVKDAKWHPFMVTERFVRAFAFHAGQYRVESLFRQAMKGDSKAIRELQHELGAERLAKDMAASQLSPASRDLYGLAMSDDVAGSTSPLRMPRWMNTPEGRVIFQFRRIAYDQTRVLKDKVWLPTTRGEFGPFLRWAAAVGLSSYVIASLTAMIKGDDDKQDKEKGPGAQAWAFMQYLNTANALGMVGDMASGINSGDDWGNTPLVGTMVGPTLSSVLHAAKDLAWDAPHKDGAGPEFKQIAKREIPLLSKLSKWEWSSPAFGWLRTGKEKGADRPVEMWNN